MVNVIVVPETDEFREDLFHNEVIYINQELGKPNLKGRNVKFIAPFLLREKKVLRVYQILDMKHVPPSYEIYLGNSFLVQVPWNNMNQHTRFEYHSLNDFNFIELIDGFLFPHNFKKGAI